MTGDGTYPGPPRSSSPKGERRRRQLLDAAVAVLLEAGVSGLSHRAVARYAKLPLSATTYYFGSLRALREEAMQHAADKWLEDARAALEALPLQLGGADAVAAAVVRIVTARPTEDALTASEVLIFYERYLEAARHPELRALVAGWNAELEQLLAEVLRRGGLRRASAAAGPMLALADGALIRALSEGRDPDSVTAIVSRFFETLAPSSRRAPS